MGEVDIKHMPEDWMALRLPKHRLNEIDVESEDGRKVTKFKFKYSSP